ncbi:Periplasmic copper-binding protein (NosD) [uncultured archaeon]|nr:Periplasmic copper-binding protein (NosD) [uncultured archaeon]
MLLNNIYGGHVPGIAAWITALALLLAGGADAATDIYSCQDIIQEGEYRLSQNLANDSTCINIQSGNVTLDGAGFTISGKDMAQTYGVFAFNSTKPLRNVTVKNLTVIDWAGGIVFSSVTYGSIANITASSNDAGISLYNSGNDIVTDNTAELNTYGIYLTDSSNNTISGNNANSNENSGVYLDYSSINILTNNIANSNKEYGIYLYYSNSSTLTNNTADLNDYYGVYIYAGNYNTLIKNNASLNIDTGIYLLYSNNNNLTNNIANSNENIGVYLDYSSINTLTNNTASLNIQKGFELSLSNHNILIDNTISSSYDGIVVDDPSSGNRIIGNRVYNTTDQGIVLIRAFNNIVSENNVSFNSGEGILVLQGSWNNTISNNIADSNGQCGGICLLNSSGSIITNNTANSNTAGLTLDSSGGNILNNNTANSNTNCGIRISGETASYTVPEVPFHFINVNTSTASTINYPDYISDYGNYTMQSGDYFIYELPFPFPFMGRNITKISVNTDGLIELLESNDDCYACDAAYGTHYYDNHIEKMDAIFANNGDLTTGDPDDAYLSSEKTYLGVFNLSDKVVVEWYGFTRTDEYPYGYDILSNPVRFQVVMYPNGTIEWNFKTMNFRTYDFDMFTGVYAKEENIEIIGGYAIDTPKSLSINLSAALPAPVYNTVRNNRLSNNNPGIYLESSNNTIYNNYLNNSNNAVASGSSIWNITRTIGSNIIDGPYLGGNFWAYPNGTGFSQLCADANADGICDSSYMPGIGNIDYQALAPFLRKTSTSITVNTDVNANQTIEISPDESRNITNSTIELNATISAPVILKINTSTDASALNATSATPVYGLDRNEQPVGRYIEVNVTGIDAASLNFVNLTMYYTAADLDMNGDGDADDPGDLNEQTLKIYWYNPNSTGDSERWKPLGPGIEPNPDYTSIGGPKVLGGERNTTADYLKVTLNHFSTFALAAEITSSGTSSSSTGNSGSSGGGGGVITSEPPGNIAAAEKYEKNIIASTPVAYTFTAPELGIYEVDVTGKESENDVSLRVEVLKDTSKLVSVSPPGTVYKNLNVWVGSKRIKEAMIKFRVGNSWLNSSDLAAGDIRMLKWNGSKWTQLDTTLIKGDASYIYYEATTDTFSNFAISGVNGASVPASSSVSQITPAATRTPEVTGTHSEEASPIRLALIIGVFALIAIIAFLYIKKNRY